MQSDQIKQGVERAPNRSLLYALGLTKEDMDRPLIGIVSSYNEIVPGHMNLDKIADAVRTVEKNLCPVFIYKCGSRWFRLVHFGVVALAHHLFF